MTKSDEISKNDDLSDTDSGFRISGSFDGHEFNPVPWEGAREIEISREIEVSREVEVSRKVDISKEIKINEESKEITTEKTKLAEQIQNRSDFRTTMASISKTSTTKLQPNLEKHPLFRQSPEKVEEISLKSSNSLVAAATTDTQTTMTIYQLIAILLIFCLILLALNVMWNNLFTTLLICCITLPILRWLGKV